MGIPYDNGCNHHNINTMPSLSVCGCCGETRIKRISKSNDIITKGSAGRPYYRCDICGTFDWAPTNEHDQPLVGESGGYYYYNRRAMKHSRNKKKKNIILDDDDDELEGYNYYETSAEHEEETNQEQDVVSEENGCTIGRRYGPVCQCGQASIQRTVKRGGPYAGRTYWCCPSYPKSGCGFFEFRSSRPPLQSKLQQMIVDRDVEVDLNHHQGGSCSDDSYTSVDVMTTPTNGSKHGHDRDDFHVVTPEIKRLKRVHFLDEVEKITLPCSRVQRTSSLIPLKDVQFGLSRSSGDHGGGGG